jgi:gliding motility-associated-like protein
MLKCFRALSGGFLLMLIFAQSSFSQTGTPEFCNSWLSLPSYQSYASMGDLDVPGHTITVEARFMRTAPYTGGQVWAGDIVSKHNNPPDVNYLLRPNSAEIATTNGYFKTPDICDIELNKIYHAAMTYDGSTLKFYRNGFLMSSTPCTGEMAQNNYSLRIGLYDALVHNEQLIGYVDEVRIWNIVRSQSEIRAFMTTALPSPATQPGLLAYYTFDDLINKQGNAAWNGVLGGAAQMNRPVPTCTFLADSCGRTPAPLAGFDMPAQVCVNTPLNITNTSVGASSYYWNFCVADLNQTPSGTNLGNPGNNLSQPVFMDYVLFNNNYYGFVVNHYPGKLIRLDFGNSLLNTPTSHDMGNFGGIIPSTWGAEGIQIVQNEGKWYAIIVGGYLASGHEPRVLKIDFGADLTNLTPVATNWGNIGNLQSPHDLHVFKEGNEWYGLTVNAYNNTITRFNFTNSFDNTPTAVNIGGFGLLQYPDGIFATNDNGNWRVFVANNDANSRLVRLDFGSSLLNTPTATSVANVGNTSGLRDLTLLKFCDQVVGFGVNGTNHNFYRMNFTDLGSNPVITNLGNIGGMVVPHSISKLFRVNDDLYAFTTNVGNNSITRIRFGGCTASSTSNSNLQTPPPIIYNTAGIYNINLTIDDGLPTQQSICKQIEVVSGPAKRPLQKLQICIGEQIKLGSAISGATYLWNTGGTTDSITVNSAGIYWVETSIAGCAARDSFEVDIFNARPEFTQRQDACSPQTIELTGSNMVNASHHYWDLGDGTNATTLEVTHTYASPGTYQISYAAGNGICADTITKLVTFGTTPGDVILIADTTICAGASITLNTSGSLSNCWQPAPGISNPQMPSPVITPVADGTYYVTAEKTGANLVTNGDFSAGNTLFQTDLVFAAVPAAEGQYFVGTTPGTWDNVSNNCRDHTTGAGNMMVVNGTTAEDAAIWKQTVNITPNTNYAFSFWVQSLSAQNPALLQLSINGRTVYHLLNATPQECQWVQFYVVWNSGSFTSADLAIVNKRLTAGGNDFAIDDISFAPVSIQHESVTVLVERPVVTANADTAICSGKPVQMNVTGAQQYTWSPATALSAMDIANPVASPEQTTQYIVTGITQTGCIAKDTVNVTIFTKPVISKQADTVICRNSSVNLWVNGGVSYNWSPSQSIDDPTSQTPVASPASNTVYQVVITDANNCEHSDSVKVAIRPPAQFQVNAPVQVCSQDSVNLLASGGDTYFWSPATGISDPASPAPRVSPPATMNYTVMITESVCGESATLQTRVNVLPLPVVRAGRSNDIDCSYGESRLSASGARTYSWTPATTLNNPAVHNPVATPQISTVYTVTGFDREGCKGTDTVIVKVSEDNKGDYLLPNAFTPNNDGLNDCFGIKFWGIVDDIEFSVFDRWGVRVFYSKDPRACWDGTYKGEKQPGGVYVYMVKASTNCQKAVFRKGTFVLVR